MTLQSEFNLIRCDYNIVVHYFVVVNISGILMNKSTAF
jgi:hypothetical protein